MLIAVGLVVLMMTLFATIFQIATGAMSTQKGLAENDQRVRLVLTRLRNDLNGFKNDPNDPSKPYRTFRKLVPYGPDEDGQPNYDTTDRYGYFYISENNPDDDTDDVLGLTIQFPPGSPDRFFGRAAVLLPQQGTGFYGSTGNTSSTYPPAGNTTVDPTTAPAGPYWRNQPDFDDVLGVPNQVGDSEAAEVCYFLRRGILYRRVLLIRNPNGLATTPTDGTPTDDAPASLNLGTYTGGSRAFWNDFDYSAYYEPNTGGLRFHGGSATTTNSLSIAGGGNLQGQNPFYLANPAYRFGFDCSLTGAGVPTTTYGLPREWIFDSTSTAYYIGRFTHGETSDYQFGYPGTIAPPGPGINPMNNSTQLSYSTTTGQVGYGGTAYSGPRASEDILMTNVLKFDIKVFDPAASVGPDGHPGVAGFVHPTTGVVDDDDGDGVADNLNELGWPGSDDGDFVDIGHMGLTGFYNAYPNTATGRTAGPRNVPITMNYNIPAPYGATELVTAKSTASMQYSYPNIYYNPGYVAGSNPPATATWANRYDTWHPKLNLNYDTTNYISDTPPYRPFDYGADGKPGVANVNDDGINGTDDEGELGWPGSDDRGIPLSAIQIKITFFDTASQQVREVTLVQSLLYTP